MNVVRFQRHGCVRQKNTSGPAPAFADTLPDAFFPPQIVKGSPAGLTPSGVGSPGAISTPKRTNLLFLSARKNQAVSVTADYTGSRPKTTPPTRFGGILPQCYHPCQIELIHILIFF